MLDLISCFLVQRSFYVPTEVLHSYISYLIFVYSKQEIAEIKVLKFLDWSITIFYNFLVQVASVNISSIPTFCG